MNSVKLIFFLSTNDMSKKRIKTVHHTHNILSEKNHINDRMELFLIHSSENIHIDFRQGLLMRKFQ